MIGESPERPAIFQRQPAGSRNGGHFAFLVQRHAIDRPVRGIHRHVIGPGDRLFIALREGRFSSPIFLGLGGQSTPDSQLLWPFLSRISRFHIRQASRDSIGQQIFFREAVILGETQSAFAHQHHVIRLGHHQLGDFRGRLDAADGANGAAAPRGTMHATGIEFHHAIFVGRPPYPTLVSFGSSSTMFTPAITASRVSPPDLITCMALSSKRPRH